MSATAPYKSNLDMSSRSVVHVKTVIPMLGGVLMIATALICLFFAVAFAIWPRLGGFVFRIGLTDPWRLLVGVPGLLAFALGLTAGRMSLLRRRFWLAVTCGGLSLIPAFWVLFFTVLMLSTGSMFMSSIWLYLLFAPLAPTVVGLALVAASKKTFS